CFNYKSDEFIIVRVLYILAEETLDLDKKKKIVLLFSRQPESEEVQKAAQYAVEMYNKIPRKKKLFKLVSVHSAQSQVTNMINFKIDAILGRTKCLKTQNIEIKSCDLDKQCQFFVTFYPQNDKHELNKKTCNRIKQKV
uniref:Cystatin domain-containing protein n=1 Tax=Poecilia mexicana TaxID=48701 RepID=A0A3B3WFM5_9TELE